MKMMHFFDVCIVYLLFKQTDITTISLTTCVFLMSHIVITLDTIIVYRMILKLCNPTVLVLMLDTWLHICVCVCVG